MSAALKSPDRLKNAECKKGHLSNWPPIPYVPEMDIITPKEDPQVYKVKLLDDSHINMHVYSHGNNKEYLMHIVAVLRIIQQRGLDTVSTDVDVQAHKVEIEQTQQLLQDFQKAHDEAIAKVYKQLRNLLSCNPQSQWDRVCRKMHERDSWAGVNGQVTKGRHPRTWMSFQDCLELHKVTVFSADAA
jgi:hypothetical protein